MNKKFLVHVICNENCNQPYGYDYVNDIIDITPDNSVYEYSLSNFLNNHHTELQKILIVLERELINNCLEYDNKLETESFILLGDFTGGTGKNSYKLFKNYLDVNKISYDKVCIVTSTRYEFDLLDSMFTGENKPTYVSANSAQLLGVKEVLEKPVERKKRFVYLNRNLNKFRLVSFIDLMRRGVLDNSFYSFFHIKNLYKDWKSEKHIYYLFNEFDDMMESACYDIPNTEWKQQLKSFWAETKYDFYNKLPYTLPGEIEEQSATFVGEQRITNSLHNVYNNSYMSLLVETHMSHDNTHFQATEKSYKTCYYRHPFLVYSTQHWLKRYQMEGYKTFSEFLDESYDNIENPFDRIFTINEQVQYLNELHLQDFKKIMRSMNDVVIHNYNITIELLQNPRNRLVFTKNKELIDTIIKKQHSKSWIFNIE